MLSITSLALGFSPVQKLQVQPPTCCSATRASVHCGLESVAPRRAVLAAALGLGATGAAPAWAGYVTSLGIVTTSPKDAERDDELLGTKEVQAGLRNLKGYQTSAKSLQARRTTPVPPSGHSLTRTSLCAGRSQHYPPTRDSKQLALTRTLISPLSAQCSLILTPHLSSLPTYPHSSLILTAHSPPTPHHPGRVQEGQEHGAHPGDPQGV